MATRGKGTVSRTGYRRILWPTDFSPLAKAALPHAVRLADAHGAELVVLHVLPSAAYYALPGMTGGALAQLQRENRGVGQAELRRVADRVKGSAPRLRVRSVLVEGAPADQIVRAARSLKCDLIVLATHGRTGMARAVMGSVAENVVRLAPCPVLTVRLPRFGARA